MLGLRLLRLDARRFCSHSAGARSALSLFILVLIGIVALADARSWFGSDRPAALGGTTGVGETHSGPSTAALIPPLAATLDLPHGEPRPDGLLRDAAGWCDGQQAGFGGRTGDGAAVLLRLVRFHDADAATHAAAGLTPATLGGLVEARMVTPPEPVDPPPLLPAAVVLALTYGGRATPAGAGTDPLILPVALLLVQTGPVVALVESIGLPPERQQAVVVDLVHAARQLPWGC